MSEEDNETLGLDASGYFKTIQEIITSHAKLEASNRALAKELQRGAMSATNMGIEFAKTGDHGETLTTKFKITAKTVRTVAAEFKMAAQESQVLQLRMQDITAENELQTAALRKFISAQEDAWVAQHMQSAVPHGGMIPGGLTQERAGELAKGLIAAEKEYANEVRQRAELQKSLDEKAEQRNATFEAYYASRRASRQIEIRDQKEIAAEESRIEAIESRRLARLQEIKEARAPKTQGAPLDSSGQIEGEQKLKRIDEERLDRRNAFLAKQKEIKALKEQELRNDKLEIAALIEQGEQLKKQVRLENEVNDKLLAQYRLRRQLESSAKAANEADAREKEHRSNRAEMAALIDQGEQLKGQAQLENEINSKLEAQLRLRRRIESDIKAANLADANRFGAAMLTHTGDSRGLDSSQRAKIASEITKINALIEKGAIGTKRAQEIVRATLAGQVSVLSGAEDKVARVTRRIQELNGDLKKGLPNQKLIDDGRKLAASFGETESASKKAALNIILSWQQMARLVSVQLIHTAIRKVLDLIKQSITEAEGFERRISEIRTISQGNAQSFNQWTDAVRKLSDEFGNPIMDVTEGTYQALSSQLVKGADAAALMGHALEFSRVTMATTAQSVYLLSAALNSYHLTVGDTERVQSVLFKTITLGHLRAEDLAETFGRTGPFAHQLGISIEEVGASIATLTRNGLPANEAMVLINNVLTHLVKPSKGMKELFSDIGVTSGEAAIQLFGFTGVLEKLEKASQGSSEELAKLFPELRSLRGSITLTGNLDEVRANLVDMREHALKEFKDALAITFESSGSKVQIEMNKIHNYILQGFGQEALGAIVTFSNNFGGLTNVFKSVIPVLGEALADFVTYKTVSFSVALGTKALTALETSRSIALSTSTASNALYNLSLEATKNRYVQLAIVQKLTTEGDHAGAAAATLSAKAHQTQATALRADAVAKMENSTATVALGRAMKGLSAVFLNPVFLATAAIGLAIHFWNKQREMEEEQRAAVKASYDYAIDQGAKMTTALEKELADQEEAWRHSFANRFVAVAEFGGRISQELRGMTDSQVSYAKEMVDATKSSIGLLVRGAEESIKDLENKAKEAAANVRNAQQDIIRDQETAEERKFQRAMQLAEHLDRLAGGKGKIVDANQMSLIADEQKRLLEKQNEIASRKGDDPLVAKANLDDMQKNIKAREKIEQDLFTRRLKMIEEQKALQASVAEDARRFANEQINAAAKKNELSLREQEIADKKLKTNDRLKRHPKERSPFDLRISGDKDAERDAHGGDSARHEQEQLRRDKEKLDNDKAHLLLLEQSLKALPAIDDFKKRELELQNANNAALEKYIEIQKKAAETLKAQAEEEKKKFATLKTALTEIEKFRSQDTGIKDTMSDETAIAANAARVKAFDDLIFKAGKAGLDNQQVILDLSREKVAIEREGELKLRALQIKHELERAERIRHDMEKHHEDMKKDLLETDKNILEGNGPIGRIRAAIGVGPASPGAIGQLIKQTILEGAPAPIGESRHLRGEAEFEEEGLRIRDLRWHLDRQIEEIEKARTLGREISPQESEQLRASIRSFKEAAEKAKVEDFLGTSAFLDTKAITGRKDPRTGEAQPDLTMKDVLHDIEYDAIELGNYIKKHNEDLKKQHDEEKKLTEQTKVLNEITLAHKDLSKATKHLGESFDDLAAELNKTIKSIKDIGDYADKHKPQTNTGGNNQGGYVEQPQVFGGNGVYTVGIGELERAKAKEQAKLDKERADLLERVQERIQQQAWQKKQLETKRAINNIREGQNEAGGTIGISRSKSWMESALDVRDGMKAAWKSIQFSKPKVTNATTKESSTINFGDINIKVTSTGNNKIDAGLLVKELQRELRRKGVSLVKEHDD